MAATATEALRGPVEEPLRTRVLGVPVDVCSDVFVAACVLHERGGGQVVTLNAEMTMAALADPTLGEAIEAARLVIPDGAGVVWALGRQGFRVRRAPGIELAQLKVPRLDPEREGVIVHPPQALAAPREGADGVGRGLEDGPDLAGHGVAQLEVGRLPVEGSSGDNGAVEALVGAEHLDRVAGKGQVQLVDGLGLYHPVE